MKTAELEWYHKRYYHVKPEAKTIEQCRSHGRDHKAYGWCIQVDTRWTEEQKTAYLAGFEEAVT